MVYLQAGLQVGTESALDSSHVLAGGDPRLTILAAAGKSKILGHDALVVDNVDTGALELLGGSERFAAMVTREDVTEGKPAPDGYLLAIRTLGVRAEDCLVAEDTPAGVRAGRAAGVGTVVGVTTSFSAEELRDAGADLVLPDLHGLTTPA